jgi:hypothetical protein
MQKTFEKAPELGSYPIQVQVFDSNDSTIIPDSATWSLFDKRGNIINARENIIVTPEAITNILLSGNDLKIGSFGFDRFLLFEFTYTSTFGAGIPDNEKLFFQIEERRGLRG